MMFVLLAGATVFSVAIWRVRAEFSGSERYAFLIWNLFLAWIPFIISYFTYILIMLTADGSTCSFLLPPSSG